MVCMDRDILTNTFIFPSTKDRPHYPLLCPAIAFHDGRLLHLRRQVLVLCCRDLPYASEADLPRIPRRASPTGQARQLGQKHCVWYRLCRYHLHGGLALVQDEGGQESTVGGAGGTETVGGYLQGW